jgi:hypothetical protein
MRPYRPDPPHAGDRPGLAKRTAPAAQEGKQIKLTEKHIQSFMGAYNDMVKLYESAKDLGGVVLGPSGSRPVRRGPRPRKSSATRQ